MSRNPLLAAVAVAASLLLGSYCQNRPAAPSVDSTGGHAGTGGAQAQQTGGTAQTTGGTSPQPEVVCLEQIGGGDKLAAGAAPARMAGGTVLTLAYPFVASLQYADGRHKCAATVIGPHLAVTAAHCKPAAGDQLRVGALNYSTGGELVHVTERCTHPRYVPDGPWDACLIHLDGPPLKSAALALHLPEKGRVLGWGRTSPDGPLSIELQKVDVVILTDAQCDVADPKDSAGPTVCAGSKDAAGGVDACFGDSGGPLLVKGWDTWELGAIVSRGRSCGLRGEWGKYVGIPGPITVWIREAEAVPW